MSETSQGPPFRQASKSGLIFYLPLNAEILHGGNHEPRNWRLTCAAVLGRMPSSVGNHNIILAETLNRMPHNKIAGMASSITLRCEPRFGRPIRRNLGVSGRCPRLLGTVRTDPR